jgi:hypothetical protein
MRVGILKDIHKSDIYRFELERENDSIKMEIINVISWDYMKINFTKSELQKFSQFVNGFLNPE